MRDREETEREMERERMREERDFPAKEQGAQLSYFYLSLHFQTLWKEAGMTWKVGKKRCTYTKAHRAVVQKNKDALKVYVLL